MKAHIVRESPVRTTGRILQMSALFDLPPLAKSRMEWDVNLPIEERPFNVGLMVGPSGSGKTTIAKELFGDRLVGLQEWSSTDSVVDSFPKSMATKEIVELLSSVGFNSPPAWLRPFGVLSNGEQFRVRCARALAESSDLIVVDEFSSVVDRQVAQIASHAIQRTIRKKDRQFIAISCHYDLESWLQPDWTYEPATGKFQWRELQRHPAINLEIRAAERSLWPIFRHHHYLSGDLHNAARCFAAYIDGRPVAFSAFMHFPHPTTKNIRMGHRLVVLPDYQGLGIGGRFDDWMGQYLYERGYRYRNVVAHPAMIAYYMRSPRWRQAGSQAKTLRSGKTSDRGRKRQQRSVRRLSLTSFEYCPPKQIVQ